jgi:hypothetical protein
MAQQNTRKTAKTEFWRTHIAKQKKSGKTEKRYCNRHELSYATFRNRQNIPPCQRKVNFENLRNVQIVPIFLA